MRRLSLLAVLALLVAPPLFAGEHTGVSMSDAKSVGDQELMLNGMGLRKKLWVEVYVAGLYLPTPQKDAAAILASDTVRHMDMRFLYDVSSGKLCGAWEDGLEANTKSPTAELEKQFDELCGMMSDVDEGGTMSYTYVPGTGTTVNVNGADKGTIEGKAFADALFACWLGPKPPNEDLKTGLLGG